MNGSIYFMTFINDYSMFCWMYFIKQKYKVFENFKVFKALVEKNVGKKIKALRFDKGGEYIKRDFYKLCASEAIQMQHYVPYTPQQNGVVERKNRSLKEMAT